MMGSEVLAGQCLHSCPPHLHRRRSPALSQALRASSKPDNVPSTGERLCCRTVLIAVTVLELSTLAGAPLFELGLLGGIQSQQQYAAHPIADSSLEGSGAARFAGQKSPSGRYLSTA